MTASWKLPFELWEYISRFLIDEQLKGMYSVNRAFFYIAMRLRYHEISIPGWDIFDPGSAAHKSYLRAVGFPESSSFIRSLAIKPVRFNSAATGPSPTTKKGHKVLALTGRLITRIKRYLPGRAEKRKAQKRQLELAHRIREFIGTLDQLTDLVVDCHTDDIALGGINSTSLTFLSKGWPVFGPNLRNLTLKGTIEIWELLLPPLHLERLEDLKIEWVTSTSTDETRIVPSILVPFIRKHSETIRTLILVSRIPVNFTAIYEGIGYLPRLRRFTLHEPLPDKYLHNPALHHFLSQHLTMLEELTWGVYNVSRPLIHPSYPESDFDQVPFSITLPNATKLTLSLWGFPKPDHFNNVVSYVGRHGRMLTSLSITGWALTLEDFNSLVNGLALPILGKLDVSAMILTPATFQKLAARLPRLHTLSLAYAKVGPGEQLSNSLTVDWTQLDYWYPSVCARQLDDFCQEMENLTLSDWPVETLHLGRSAYHDWMQFRVEVVGKVVLRSMPRVGFINGKYREDFLQLPV